MADGFLGRWSQRKQQVREGRPLAQPVPPSPQPSPAGGRGGDKPSSLQTSTLSRSATGEQLGGSLPLPPAGEGGGEGAVKNPLPTLDDVQALTPESDFKPFLARDVDPQVKNAAMKKLFADPHFNVMDGLDIYIDDYSKPDPLPDSMLRQMTSAKFLNLFDDEKTETAAQAVRDNAGPSTTPLAQAASPSQESSEPSADAPEPVPAAAPQITTQDHAHTDLRLQQDHAAGPQGPGGGAG